MGIYSLFAYFIEIFKASRKLVVNFFHIHSPETLFILNTSRNAAIGFALLLLATIVQIAMQVSMMHFATSGLSPAQMGQRRPRTAPR